jgi:predicted lipoprotein with Yx(FWY)xxD motif
MYTYDKDEPGKSNCVDECAKVWPPVLAADNAKPTGEWSIVTRADGSRQWAFRGKPFYTYTKEAPTSMGMGMGMASGTANGHDVDGVWHIFEVRPEWWLKLPTGLNVTEVPTVPGMALSNAANRPLYTFSGKTGTAGSLPPVWSPVRAPQVAIPVGEFSVVAREDGVYQWALNGKLLFTYAGDVEIGDTNGKSLDPRLELAMVMRYFMPNEVAVSGDQHRGGILVTADTGQVLYARDRAYANMEGGHHARGGNRGNPMTGRSIGLTGCDAECEKTWRPLKAPADAQASGHWSVLARADGAKQWAYQGYALYTYSKEKPGQITGDDMFDLAVNDDVKVLVASNLGLY